jgi:hypothetical protein
MKSQTAQILEYLETGKALTPLQALDEFGCFRLSARILELKKMGKPINSHKLKLPNGKSVASYRMAIR